MLKDITTTIKRRRRRRRYNHLQRRSSSSSSSSSLLSLLLLRRVFLLIEVLVLINSSSRTGHHVAAAAAVVSAYSSFVTSSQACPFLSGTPSQDYHGDRFFRKSQYPQHQQYKSQQSYSSSSSSSSPTLLLSMKTRVAIVGLPNVGKSTLFNALAQKSIAQAENFPFCTIEPNRTPIAMPDSYGYLQALGQFAKSQKTIPAHFELVDVAGLVAGASRGEGLGNRFLGTVRECDAICHVIRYFDDDNIIHVDGRVAPADDAEVVNLELVLADIAHIERRIEKTTCSGDERVALERLLLPALQEGIPARAVGLSETEQFAIKSMGLLTLKPVLYAFNVNEEDFLLDKQEIEKRAQRVFESIQYCDASRDMFTIVCAKLASMLTDPVQAREYLDSIGILDEKDRSSGDADNDQAALLDEIMGYSVLPNMIRQLLNLFVVYVGPGVAPERSRTTRGFLFRKSTNAPVTAIGLAGRLHGDIQKGFIRAEVTRADELLEHSSYTAAKDAGVVRTEGKDYVLNKHDVVLIKWK